jgi:4a-hydroxytetrahydrobiopterin dehydratase
MFISISLSLLLFIPFTVAAQNKNSLYNQYCEPCHNNNIKKLSSKQIHSLIKRLPGQWRADNDNKIFKKFTFTTHEQLYNFIDKIASICETEGHHANFEIADKSINLIIYTHSINGLSENDFILAAKIMYQIINKNNHQQPKIQNHPSSDTKISCKTVKNWRYNSSSNSKKYRTFIFDSFLSCIKKSIEVHALIAVIKNQYQLESYKLQIEFNQLRIDVGSKNQNFVDSEQALLAINELILAPKNLDQKQSHRHKKPKIRLKKKERFIK